MKIEWNRVTWYSKLLAIALFALVSTSFFYIGIQYERFSEQQISSDAQLNAIAEQVGELAIEGEQALNGGTKSKVLEFDPSNKKVYRNEEYGFAFEYPGELSFDSGVSEGSFFVCLSYTGSAGACIADLTILPDGNFDEVYEESKEAFKGYKIKESPGGIGGVIGAEVAKLIDIAYGQGQEDYSNTLLFKKDGFIYKLESARGGGYVFYSLLSGWIFLSEFSRVGIDPNNAIQIPDDWVLYQSEKWGFEFKYPSDWIVKGEGKEWPTYQSLASISNPRHLGRVDTDFPSEFFSVTRRARECYGEPIDLWERKIFYTDWRPGMGSDIKTVCVPTENWSLDLVFSVMEEPSRLIMESILSTFKLR